ncbi:hypothetical protein PV327_000535 [Microctonus hyperodae]|uniref:Securin n=1 Tax=Microctonus hyperodae TaxID=165561 RepID=A0AA39G6W4_MICHY|nr:hypothetical protein PV327_000535 [Microctonus hyperodae]
MSNIFDLFGTTSFNISGHQIKRNTLETMGNPIKLRTLSDSGTMGLKNAMATAGSKPKGLSFRQPSDPNICNTNSQQINNKNVLLKPTLKTSTSNLKPLIPRDNKEKISKVIREKHRKGLSPVTKSPHGKFTAQKQGNEFQFKKPLAPLPIQKNLKVYPKPEKLTYDWDHEKFDRISCEILPMDKEVIELVRSRQYVTPFEDEIFIPDAELLNVPSLSPINFVDAELDNFDEIAMTPPEIPVISDDDNGDF